MLVQKSSKNLPQIVQKSRSGGSKIEVQRVQIPPTSSSGEGFGRLGGVLGVSWGVLGCLWVSWGRLGPSCDRPGGVLGRLGSKKVANMAPTWCPKRNQNREKIEAKIDQNFDGSWDRIFKRFWWILKVKFIWYLVMDLNQTEVLMRLSCEYQQKWIFDDD